MRRATSSNRIAWPSDADGNSNSAHRTFRFRSEGPHACPLLGETRSSRVCSPRLCGRTRGRAGQFRHNRRMRARGDTHRSRDLDLRGGIAFVPSRRSRTAPCFECSALGRTHACRTDNVLDVVRVTGRDRRSPQEVSRCRSQCTDEILTPATARLARSALDKPEPRPYPSAATPAARRCACDDSSRSGRRISRSPSTLRAKACRRQAARRLDFWSRGRGDRTATSRCPARHSRHRDANAGTHVRGDGSRFGGGESGRPRARCTQADCGGSAIFDMPHDIRGSGTVLCRVPCFGKQMPTAV